MQKITLFDIIDYKTIEINEFKKIHKFSEFEKQIPKKQKSFFKSLKDSDCGIIAEIKRKSPSEGIICTLFNPQEIAHEYTEIGVNAISVLTDKNFFGGDIKYLESVASVTDIPLLRKDFIIDEIQLLEARACGASASLLIVSALKQARLEQLINFCKELEMDALVEIHTVDEVKIAIDSGASIIGVNNRDLKTFKVNLEISKNILPMIPHEFLKISESGISSSKDIKELKAKGADAFLIGTAFMRSNEKKEFLNKLLHEN
ncbi:MAG: hypothetical protein ACD_79C00721G0007 [uncultured bacterium]|nr:MAG: hypothetical protein ACD_79C00721G0007 [uncultured bacterium]